MFKLLKGNLTRMKWGSSAVEDLMLYYSSSTANTIGREATLAWILLYYTLHTHPFPLPLATAQPMRDSYSSANRKPLYFELPVYSNGVFAYNSPPNFSLSSIKECSSSLFSRLVCGFCYSLDIQGCNSLLIPNKLIFAGKINGIF